MNMSKLQLQDLDCKGKKVLMRVDFNVPLDEQGAITDDTRLKESLPSIQYILDAGGSVILMSHLGRPKGKKDSKYSLSPCAKRLSELLSSSVYFVNDCIGEEVEKKAKDLKPKEILLLENLRFYPAEEKPDQDPSFAKQLAKLGDLYVNDAFGTAHRAHSSTHDIAKYFPKRAAAGLLMQKEMQFLGRLVQNPEHPFYAIIGGAKISSKIGVLHSLLSKVDAIFLGGGMAYTFFKIQGLSIGDSLFEESAVEDAKRFLTECKKKSIPVFFPKDIVIANAFNEHADHRIVPVNQGIPLEWQGMDIGPMTLKEWETELKKGKTIFWNGPLGVFEFQPFAKGTQGIANILAHSKATTIVGGGDSIAAINSLNLAKSFTHLSTGGGASLEFIEFGHLPGIDALSDK